MKPPFPQEYSFTSHGGVPSMHITGCDVMDLAAHITWQIHYIYGRLGGISPELAAEFREMTVAVVSDPQSPCWEDVEDTPGAMEICFALPKEEADET